MSWFKTKDLRSSIYALFSVGTTPPPADDTARLEEIREVMLTLSQMDGGTDHSASLTRRIRYATDLQVLWFLRGELMGLLARSVGEAVALEKMDRLSEMFSGLLPRGLRSRPSPLNPNYRNSRPAEDYRNSRPGEE